MSYRVLLQKQKEIQDQAVVEVCWLGKNPASVISWDNFEYQDDRCSERVKEPRRFQFITAVIACLNLKEDVPGTLRRERRNRVCQPER